MEKMEFSGKQKAEAMQYRWTKLADVWKTEALVLILLTAFTFVINRHMEIKGLYMDDLYQWFCFNDNPFFAAVFTSGGTRFRALYNLAAWTEMKLFGTHVNWYMPFNIVLNSCLARSMLMLFPPFSLLILLSDGPNGVQKAVLALSALLAVVLPGLTHAAHAAVLCVLPGLVQILHALLLGLEQAVAGIHPGFPVAVLIAHPGGKELVGQRAVPPAQEVGHIDGGREHHDF